MVAFLAGMMLSGCKRNLPIFGQVWFPDIIPWLGENKKETGASEGKTKKDSAAAEHTPTLGAKAGTTKTLEDKSKPEARAAQNPELIAYVTLINSHYTVWTMPAMPPLDVKSIEDHKQLTLASYDSWLPTFSPDGRNIAYMSNADGNSNLWVMDRRGRSMTRLTGFHRSSISKRPNYERVLSWSSDSRYLALVNDGLLWVIPSDGFNPQTIDLPLANEHVVSACWSKAGETIGYFLGEGRNDFGLWLVRPEYKDSTQHIATELDYPIIEWSNEEDKLAFFRHGIVLLHVDQKEEQVLKMDDADIYLRWRPGGDQLVYVKAAKGGRCDIWFLDNLSSTEATARAEQPLVKDADFPCWSPDGKTIAYVSNDDVWTIGVDGTGRRRLTIRGAWSPDWGPTRGERNDAHNQP